MTSTKESERQRMRVLLVRLLKKYSVREDMYLPILLMLGNHIGAMLELMIHIMDNNPTEHEIVQRAVLIQDGMIRAGELED